MAASVRFEDNVEVPLGIGSLADVRRWAFSDAFPKQGRIDYIAGSIEVDMSPEEFFCHGTVKTTIVGDRCFGCPKDRRLDRVNSR